MTQMLSSELRKEKRILHIYIYARKKQQRSAPLLVQFHYLLSHELSSVVIHPGLFKTWSKAPSKGFSWRGIYHPPSTRIMRSRNRMLISPFQFYIISCYLSAYLALRWVNISLCFFFLVYSAWHSSILVRFICLPLFVWFYSRMLMNDKIMFDRYYCTNSTKTLQKREKIMAHFIY